MVIYEDMQVTKDGNMETVFNGVQEMSYSSYNEFNSDFDYELAYYRNPSGSSIAFVQFNVTLVPAVEFPSYEIENLNDKYPTYE